MKRVSLQEAHAQLSRLVDEAANGDGFVIAKDGKPLVKVVAVEDIPAAEATRWLSGR